MKKKVTKRKVKENIDQTENLTELHFLWSMQEMQEKVFENAKKHGWWDVERNDGELIALMHSELSEALEVLRRDPDEKDKKCPKFKNLEIELADTVIRIMDYAGARKLRLAEAILAKMAFNTTRPYKHNKKF